MLPLLVRLAMLPFQAWAWFAMGIIFCPGKFGASGTIHICLEFIELFVHSYPSLLCKNSGQVCFRGGLVESRRMSVLEAGISNFCIVHEGA